MSGQRANPRRAARQLMAAARKRAHRRYMDTLSLALVEAGYDVGTIQARLLSAELAYRWIKGAP